MKGCKICGISDSDTLNFIINHKHPPKFIGFICNYKKSSRYVEVKKLNKLLTLDKKKSNFVAVLVKPDEEILEITELENGQLYYNEAWKMFDKFWYNNSRFFGRVKKVLDSERFLWTVKGGGYAGTLDNVSEMIDDSVKIIDYKNSRKPKREEWIQDYFRQTAAYWVAYWDRTGIKAHGAEIWIANEIDLMPQCFELTAEDLKHYYKSFMEIRESYREKYGE